ncbi:protein kinase [Candidatus Chlorohelix sp.]|uniref:WD40 repeat domain-containing serine/threonine protein kinase n=1 Tax=Candidatus Chlorohelix sp. TaxID=3139201 RepID=UPI00302E88C2
MAAGEIKQIGTYEVRGVLGKGGMAIVYRCYQPNLNREVAIKVMSARFIDDAATVERFKREAFAIASLHHPNILTVFDTGQFGDVPYIVTELLSGKTLRERLGKPLDLNYASRILLQVASALDYAHENGIVHRDVKPSNVLLDQRDRAVLSDFGIVKLLNDSASRHLTATGIGVGTPEYMSPEQGMGDALDGRSDQYSLGVMLYEMVTGVTPFRADTPIAILMAHVNRALPDPRQHNPELSPEVVEVLHKVLAKNPNDRYKSCTDFAMTFEHAIQNPTMNVPLRPISPEPEPTISARNIPPGDATMPVDVLKEKRQNTPPPPPENLDRLATQISVSVEPSNNVTRLNEATVKPGEAPTRLVTPPGGTSVPPPYSGYNNSQTFQPYQTPPTGTPVPPPPPYYPPQQPTKKGGRGGVVALVVGIVAVVIIVSVVVIVLVATKGLSGDDTPTAVAITSNTTQNTATAEITQTSATAQPTTTTPPRTTAATSTSATSTTQSPITTAPYTTTAPPVTTLAATETAVLSEHSNSVPIAAWSPDGKTLATGSWDNTARLWNTQGKSFATLTGHTGWVVIVAWSPDGTTLATGSLDSTIRLWKADGAFISELKGHSAEVTNIAWSPDGKTLASGSKDFSVRLWSADGKPIATMQGHTNTVVLVTWSPNGKTLASGSWDKTVRLWSSDAKPIATLSGHTSEVSMVAWSPDGKVVASASKDKTVRLWSAEGKAIATLTGHSDEVYTLAWSPDSKYLASSSGDKSIRLWNEDGKYLLSFSGHQGPVYTLAWSPDSKYLASGSGDKTARIWNLEGKELAVLSGHTDLISTVVWSPDGKSLVTCSYDKTARIWKI